MESRLQKASRQAAGELTCGREKHYADGDQTKICLLENTFYFIFLNVENLNQGKEAYWWTKQALMGSWLRFDIDNYSSITLEPGLLLTGNVARTPLYIYHETCIADVFQKRLLAGFSKFQFFLNCNATLIAMMCFFSYSRSFIQWAEYAQKRSSQEDARCKYAIASFRRKNRAMDREGFSTLWTHDTE